ncbi:hypothetical protein [Clostridium sp.]|nr:hypothetical protein [Clostridium sp.]MBK5240771.1 hypothetical protein [Clostridium sp.]
MCKPPSKWGCGELGEDGPSDADLVEEFSSTTQNMKRYIIFTGKSKPNKH